MRDILTVTLNPALDIATEVDGVVPGLKLRCDAPRTDPGGGGINVSRAIALLGGAPRTFAVLSGHAGLTIADLLAETGLPEVIAFRGAPETRSSLAVTDRLTGSQYRFMLPGAPWPEGMATEVADRIVAEARPGSLVVVSGSLPPGCPPEMLADLTARLTARDAKPIYDTSGPALSFLASGRAGTAHVLRMNQTEADEIANRRLRSVRETAAFAQALVKRGAAAIVVAARGPEGSVLATTGQRLHATSAEDVPVRSRVGAGDSFVGAFTLALAEERPLPEALARAVAAASAAVMTEGTMLCRPEDVERLIPFCTATPV